MRRLERNAEARFNHPTERRDRSRSRTATAMAPAQGVTGIILQIRMDADGNMQIAPGGGAEEVERLAGVTTRSRP